MASSRPAGKGKAQKQMAEVGLNNKSILTLVAQLMRRVSFVLSAVSVCSYSKLRYALMGVTNYQGVTVNNVHERL